MNPADPFGLVGQVLEGQFRVERLVGEGGFSAVYRGHHLGLDEPVAIKCLKLPPSLGRDLVETFVQRFRDESRLLYRLSQGNLHIVRSIAAGATTSPSAGFLIPYMVLEWLEGRALASDFTVRKTIGKTGRPLDELVSVFGTAADALAFAHGQGVVHRDLNPGNLFFAQTPQGVKLKVLDFGVAKILDDSTLNLGPRAQTMGQIRIFAPAYGAPEQFDDALGRIGPSSDVYSFALVLMEAMRDRPVNDGANLGEFATAALDPSRRPTPRALGVDVPDAVEEVFARATRLSPAERFANVGDMWKAFSSAVASGTKKNERAAAPRPAAGGSLARTLPLNSPKLSFNAQAPEAPPDSVDEDELPTRIGQAPRVEPENGPREEEEEDVTRVRAPEPMMLRELADAEARGAIPKPIPAAGAPPPALGGTLMMHPESAVPIPPPPAPFVPNTTPAAFPAAPVGGAMGSTLAHQPSPFHGQPLAPPPPAAAPPEPPITGQHAMPPAMPAHFAQPQPPFMMSPGAPPQAGYAEAAPAPPASKPPIALLVAMAALLVVGLAGIGFWVVSGRDTATVTDPTTEPVPEPVPVPTAAPTPTPTTAPTAPPIAEPEPVAEVDAGSAAAEPANTAAPPDTTPTATATAAPTATSVATATARPVPVPEPVDDRAWNESAARARLSQANGVLVFCRTPDGQTGPGSATVTFSPDGTVSSVVMDSPYAGTKAGDCVAGQFKRAKVAPFDGGSHTIKHSFEVPK